MVSFNIINVIYIFSSLPAGSALGKVSNDSTPGKVYTSYLSRTRGRCPCNFFLAGVNFYRFNAKNWHFRQILREKVAFFLQI